MFYRVLLLAAAVLLGGCREQKVNSLMREAMSLAQAGDVAGWEAAQAKVRQCRDLGSTAEPVMTMYALSLVQTNELDRALEAAQAAAQKYPGSFLANYLVGKVCLVRGQYAEAVPALQKAQSLRPDDLNTLVLLAVSTARANRPEAAQLFSKLQQQNAFSSTPELYNEWALFYVRQDLPTKALGLFNQAKQLPRVAPEVFLNLAVVYDQHLKLAPTARREMARRNYVQFLVNSQGEFPDKARKVQDRLRFIREDRLSRR